MSTIKTTTLSNLAGTSTVPVDTVVQGSAKAWVNFNGTGTVAISASFNVSSITDNGTGNYNVNFTTAMPDANYATLVTSSVAINSSDSAVKSNYTTPSSVRVYSMTATGDNTDSPYLGVSIFR